MVRVPIERIAWDSLLKVSSKSIGLMVVHTL